MILADYLRFLRSPTYQTQSEPVRWGEFVTFLLLYLVFGYVINPLYERIDNYFELTHALEDVDTTTIILGIVLIPPLEELTFRLGLRITRVTLFVIAFLVLFVGVILLSISQFGGLLLMSGCVGLLLLVLTGHQEELERVVARWFGFFFYASTGLFALVHITNFSPLNASTLLLSPVLVLPQFVVGTMMGYLRVRYGIGFSILFHLILNAILFALIEYFPT